MRSREMVCDTPITTAETAKSWKTSAIFPRWR
jgi:hypothetical protein